MEHQKIILVAMTADQIIGQAGRIPWHIPEELHLFRRLTMGHAILMGRRTFDSIGHPLPGRRNIVLSRSLQPAPGIVICPNLSQGLIEGAAHGTKTFIVGGREVYQESLPLADLLRISWISGDFKGDVRFPSFSWSDWEEVSSADGPGFRHAVYRRK